MKKKKHKQSPSKHSKTSNSSSSKSSQSYSDVLAPGATTSDEPLSPQTIDAAISSDALVMAQPSEIVQPESVAPVIAVQPADPERTPQEKVAEEVTTNANIVSNKPTVYTTAEATRVADPEQKPAETQAILGALW
ncbi:unnamed protein product [Arabis nemorensis]|uniref:Uncharacterized protein n=1 Tax=Arabis nemorensis TaxID=586526 RepID=A0A565AWL4_9BRAS|nr:unnamed protein product [Arabis nemorensis]